MGVSDVFKNMARYEHDLLLALQNQDIRNQESLHSTSSLLLSVSFSSYLHQLQEQSQSEILRGFIYHPALILL